MKNGSEQTRQEPVESVPAAGRLLIVGAGGMLGTALRRVAPERGFVPLAYNKDELDITDRSAAQRVIAEFAAEASKAAAAAGIPVPCTVINAAAYTDVERAEDDTERAYLVNEHAASWLAEEAGRQGLAFVHVSTDFVFDGSKGTPYVETDDPHPLSVYGSSKLAGEQAVLSVHPSALVIRTAWTYGLGGTSFPMKILRRAQTLIADALPGSDIPVLRVVSDETGSPTYAVDLAKGLLALLSSAATGLYHLAGAGSCSRYELALEVCRLAGIRVPADLSVEPVSSADYPTKAVRPPASALDCSKAARLGVRLPAWQDGLARFVAEL